MKIKWPCHGEGRGDRVPYPLSDIFGAAPARGVLRMLCILLPAFTVSFGWAQPVVNVNYGNISFLDASKSHKVGTNGESAGNKTLYTNVVTAEGIQIDCIVTTVSITNGYFQLPTTPCAGTIPFDYKSPENCPPSGGTVTLTGNEDRYFTPTVYLYSGEGNVRFKFEFILGGTYDPLTGSGQPVILKNVMVNSYDIDGNGASSPGTNQYNDFSGFNKAARATPGSNILSEYNATTGLTRFRSNTHNNITDVKNAATRIRVEYNYLQEFEVVVGKMGGNAGRAFFLFDFGPGPIWTPFYLTSPELDLDPDAEGYNNNTTFCQAPVKLTKGASNITNTNNAIDELIISFPAADIKDGNLEILSTDANNASVSLTLGSPFSGNVLLTVGGMSVRVDKMESNGTRSLRFYKSDGGTFTNAEMEVLLDALSYANQGSPPTAGSRQFTAYIREGILNSTFAFFEVFAGCMVLSTRITAFHAAQERDRVRIDWMTSAPEGVSHFEVERSTDGGDWSGVSRIAGGPARTYTGTDRPGRSGTYLYRLIEYGLNGVKSVSQQRVVRFRMEHAGLRVFPNPSADGRIHVTPSAEGLARVLDTGGAEVWRGRLAAGGQWIDLGKASPGVHILQTADGQSVRFWVR